MINAATTSAISSFAGNLRNRAAKIVAAKRRPMQNRIVQGSGGADTVVTSDQIPYASTTSATVNSRLELPLADGKCMFAVSFMDGGDRQHRQRRNLVALTRRAAADASARTPDLASS